MRLPMQHFSVTFHKATGANMETIIPFFRHIQPWERTLILAGGLLLFWILEGIVPLVRFRYHKVRHAGLNLFFTLTTIVVNFAFATLIIRAADYTTLHRNGLLWFVHLPSWLFTLGGLLILDFIGAWLIHWLHHEIKWMWKLHLINHSDTGVDPTTANRHSPGVCFLR